MGHVGRLPKKGKEKSVIKFKEKKEITGKYDAYGLEEARSF